MVIVQWGEGGDEERYLVGIRLVQDVFDGLGDCDFALVGGFAGSRLNAAYQSGWRRRPCRESQC